MRDAFVIAGLAVIAVGIGGGVFWYSRAGTADASYPAQVAAQPAAVAVSVTELTSGEHSMVTDRKNFLITSKVQFANLWKMLDQNDLPPPVDFEKQQVIAVFAGKEPTSGYEIVLNDVQDIGGKRMVSVLIHKPATDCVTAQTITTPYYIAAVPASALPLEHADQVVSPNCVGDDKP